MKRTHITGSVFAAVLALCLNRDVSASSRAAFDLLRPGSHAAVGLGGDPFLSALEDDVGWWSELRLDNRPGALAELETSRPADLGGGSGFESRQARWSATAVGRLGSASWTGGVGFDEPLWKGAWQGDPGGLSLRGSGRGVVGGLRVRTLPGLSWQLAGLSGGAASGYERSTLGAGVRYRHRSGSTVQSSWQRAHRSDELRSSLYGEPLEVFTNLSQVNQRVEGRWVAPWGFELEGTVARTRWLPFEAAAAAPRYHFDPAGNSAFDQAGLHWDAPRRRALLRWTRLDLDVKGAVSWWGQGFGGLDYARAGLESWLSAVELSTTRPSRWLLEFERARLDARARGDIESWPFTSTLVDLLGQRRIFRLQGTAAWERWHVAHERPWGFRVHGRVGAEWIDLRPQGRLESWRPTFLVFGKSDARVDPLSVQRVQLGVLSLGAARRVAGIDLDLGLEQCVFARVHDARDRTSAAREPDPTPVSSAPEESGTGTRVRLTASRRF